MSRFSKRTKLLRAAGLAGLLAAVPGVHTGFAQNLNDMVRTLNNVINPGDAQRLEDQARRNGRSQEERYWRDYRAGLDSPDRDHRDYGREGNRANYRGQGDQRDYGREGDRPNYRGQGNQRYPSDDRGDSGYQRDYRDQRDYRNDQR
jgi:hypothetical protein